MKKDKNDVITFPNILSMSRIILSPIIFFIKDNKYILFSVLIIIGFTDVMDGYIARKYKSQTILGSWLDSVSDFVFYILLAIYAIIFELEIIVKINYCIIIIITLKLFTIILGYLKYRKLCFFHTIGNKVSGIIIFIGFCIFVLSRNTIIINIGIIISIISSLEELIITVIGKRYKENIKGIWELN